MAENNAVDVVTDYHNSKVKPKIKELDTKIENLKQTVADNNVEISLATAEQIQAMFDKLVIDGGTY